MNFVGRLWVALFCVLNLYRSRLGDEPENRLIVDTICNPARIGPGWPERDARPMKLTVEFEREEDGRWLAEVADLPGEWLTVRAVRRQLHVSKLWLSV